MATAKKCGVVVSGHSEINETRIMILSLWCSLRNWNDALNTGLALVSVDEFLKRQRVTEDSFLELKMISKVAASQINNIVIKDREDGWT
jgi:hypothetical protein